MARDCTMHVVCVVCAGLVELQVDLTDYAMWRNGTLIQHAMPYLSAAEREVLISRVCAVCFDKNFREG